VEGLFREARNLLMKGVRICGCSEKAHNPSRLRCGATVGRLKVEEASLRTTKVLAVTRGEKEVVGGRRETRWCEIALGVGTLMRNLKGK